ncbi:hypothetical protein A2U01_0058887 [Trifolium medium]|uniref:Uncharacterized protein n=1 Tax=Trifolium medium TaxID=97028 RepID=A0A392RM18_9FABA|nr:hypothetical protein [Trifolium medium]
MSHRAEFWISLEEQGEASDFTHGFRVKFRTGRNVGSAWKNKVKLLTSRMDFAWCEIGAKKSKHAVRTNYA